MAVKEMTMYTVQCDNCKKVFEGEDFACWNEFDFALDEAKESEWIETDDGENHYCPECAHHNDEDELIIDESRKKP